MTQSETPLGSSGSLWTPETRLYSDGVVRASGGGPLVVPPYSGHRRIPGTCFLDPTSGRLPDDYLATQGEVDEARARLARADLPGRDGPFADMAETALLDLAAVCFPNGAAVAAASPHWRYVWPRDAGFVAAAFSLVGWHDLAEDVLAYVASVQGPDGTWQARYLPDGSGRVPDDRGLQLDGNGWFLWSTWVGAQLAASTAPAVSDRLWVAARAALRAVVALVDPTSGLPPCSQDFWELDTDEVTLGVAAPVLLALRTGADIASWREDVALADAASSTARRLEATIHDTFGRRGYPRRSSGRGGVDASVAFLLPPFRPADEMVESAWRDALGRLRLANGGLRPGEEWADLLTAWTPQTSLFAMTAASLGDRSVAAGLLGWLASHRTGMGALPEKVTADGQPAAVAPLPLTGATVLIALAALDGRTLPTIQAAHIPMNADHATRTTDGNSS